ncbi:uncharacterized protein MONBRDRAFT_38956 [Monosiga brevicollis MX1]|uniref:AAA+ ATPase domain-containing protein n=1 Tax=Monosiga brevicollis TaxID=81824 RepID=A9VB61_MONBE|nr:uncharacterized protein MONBRDRAFT_38956 [Monosiga brevicollis MX1]EDQ85131.1 predicted protein [Monosiga brevicollis MX1]|eukprot:XP_001749956.1 hypothetical protein [Monosiga brevicollis MX1]
MTKGKGILFMHFWERDLKLKAWSLFTRMQDAKDGLCVLSRILPLSDIRVEDVATEPHVLQWLTEATTYCSSDLVCKASFLWGLTDKHSGLLHALQENIRKTVAAMITDFREDRQQHAAELASCLVPEQRCCSLRAATSLALGSQLGDLNTILNDCDAGTLQLLCWLTQTQVLMPSPAQLSAPTLSSVLFAASRNDPRLLKEMTLGLPQLSLLARVWPNVRPDEVNSLSDFQEFIDEWHLLYSEQTLGAADLWRQPALALWDSLLQHEHDWLKTLGARWFCQWACQVTQAFAKDAKAIELVRLAETWYRWRVSYQSHTVSIGEASINKVQQNLENIFKAKVEDLDVSDLDSLLSASAPDANLTWPEILERWNVQAALETLQTRLQQSHLHDWMHACENVLAVCKKHVSVPAEWHDAVQSNGRLLIQPCDHEPLACVTSELTELLGVASTIFDFSKGFTTQQLIENTRALADLKRRWPMPLMSVAWKIGKRSPLHLDTCLEYLKERQTVNSEELERMITESIGRFGQAPFTLTVTRLYLWPYTSIPSEYFAPHPPSFNDLLPLVPDLMRLILFAKRLRLAQSFEIICDLVDGVRELATFGDALPLWQKPCPPEEAQPMALLWERIWSTSLNQKLPLEAIFPVEQQSELLAWSNKLMSLPSHFNDVTFDQFFKLCDESKILESVKRWQAQNISEDNFHKAFTLMQGTRVGGDFFGALHQCYNVFKATGQGTRPSLPGVLAALSTTLKQNASRRPIGDFVIDHLPHLSTVKDLLGQTMSKAGREEKDALVVDGWLEHFRNDEVDVSFLLESCDDNDSSLAMPKCELRHQPSQEAIEWHTFVSICASIQGQTSQAESLAALEALVDGALGQMAVLHAERAFGFALPLQSSKTRHSFRLQRDINLLERWSTFLSAYASAWAMLTAGAEGARHYLKLRRGFSPVQIAQMEACVSGEASGMLTAFVPGARLQITSSHKRAPAYTQCQREHQRGHDLLPILQDQCRALDELICNMTPTAQVVPVGGRLWQQLELPANKAIYCPRRSDQPLDSFELPALTQLCALCTVASALSRTSDKITIPPPSGYLFLTLQSDEEMLHAVHERCARGTWMSESPLLVFVESLEAFDLLRSQSTMSWSMPLLIIWIHLEPMDANKPNDVTEVPLLDQASMHAIVSGLMRKQRLSIRLVCDSEVNDEANPRCKSHFISFKLTKIAEQEEHVRRVVVGRGDACENIVQRLSGAPNYRHCWFDVAAANRIMAKVVWDLLLYGTIYSETQQLTLSGHDRIIWLEVHYAPLAWAHVFLPQNTALPWSEPLLQQLCPAPLSSASAARRLVQQAAAARWLAKAENICEPTKVHMQWAQLLFQRRTGAGANALPTSNQWLRWFEGQLNLDFSKIPLPCFQGNAEVVWWEPMQSDGAASPEQTVQHLESVLKQVYGEKQVHDMHAQFTELVMSPLFAVRLVVLSLLYQLRGPIILEGETGVGKTYLLRVFCALLGESVALHQLDMLPSTTGEDIMTFLKAVPSDSNSTQIAFLDEINCSNAIDVAASIVSEPSAIHATQQQGGIWIVAACNPFQSREASYHVLPMPDRLEAFVWRLDARSPTETEFLLRRLLENNEALQDLNENEKELALDTALRLHGEVQSLAAAPSGTTVCSPPSTRTIVHLGQLATFLKSILPLSIFVVNHVVPQTSPAFLVAVECVYLAGLPPEQASEVLATAHLSRDATCPTYLHSQTSTASSLGWLACAANWLMNACGFHQLPGIVLTHSLMINTFLLFCHIFAPVPLFVVGEPGTSKSLCLHLIFQYFSCDPFARVEELRLLPRITMSVLQSSPLLTSAMLKEEFERARQYQLAAGVRTVVCLEEASLVLPDPVRRSQPPTALKALHSLLEEHGEERDPEQPKCRVSFICLSNHLLDSAKLNRGTVLRSPTLHWADVQRAIQSLFQLPSQSTEEESGCAWKEWCDLLTLMIGELQGQARDVYAFLGDTRHLLAAAATASGNPHPAPSSDTIRSVLRAFARNVQGSSAEKTFCERWRDQFVNTFLDCKLGDLRAATSMWNDAWQRSFTLEEALLARQKLSEHDAPSPVTIASRQILCITDLPLTNAWAQLALGSARQQKMKLLFAPARRYSKLQNGFTAHGHDASYDAQALQVLIQSLAETQTMVASVSNDVLLSLLDLFNGHYHSFDGVVNLARVARGPRSSLVSMRQDLDFVVVVSQEQAQLMTPALASRFCKIWVNIDCIGRLAYDKAQSWPLQQRVEEVMYEVNPFLRWTFEPEWLAAMLEVDQEEETQSQAEFMLSVLTSEIVRDAKHDKALNLLLEEAEDCFVVVRCVASEWDINILASHLKQQLSAKGLAVKETSTLGNGRPCHLASYGSSFQALICVLEEQPWDLCSRLSEISLSQLQTCWVLLKSPLAIEKPCFRVPEFWHLLAFCPPSPGFQRLGKLLAESSQRALPRDLLEAVVTLKTDPASAPAATKEPSSLDGIVTPQLYCELARDSAQKRALATSAASRLFALSSPLFPEVLHLAQDELALLQHQQLATGVEVSLQKVPGWPSDKDCPWQITVEAPAKEQQDHLSPVQAVLESVRSIKTVRRFVKLTADQWRVLSDEFHHLKRGEQSLQQLAEASNCTLQAKASCNDQVELCVLACREPKAQTFCEMLQRILNTDLVVISTDIRIADTLADRRNRKLAYLLLKQRGRALTLQGSVTWKLYEEHCVITGWQFEMRAARESLIDHIQNLERCLSFRYCCLPATVSPIASMTRLNNVMALELQKCERVHVPSVYQHHFTQAQWESDTRQQIKSKLPCTKKLSAGFTQWQAWKLCGEAALVTEAHTELYNWLRSHWGSERLGLITTARFEGLLDQLRELNVEWRIEAEGGLTIWAEVAQVNTARKLWQDLETDEQQRRAREQASHRSELPFPQRECDERTEKFCSWQLHKPTAAAHPDNAAYGMALSQYEAMGGAKAEVKRIDMIKTIDAFDRYQTLKTAFAAQGYGTETWIFHGTDVKNRRSIQELGLVVGGEGEVPVARGRAYGPGIYSATKCTTPKSYGKLIILARALQGRKGASCSDGDCWPGGGADVWVFRDKSQVLPLFFVELHS